MIEVELPDGTIAEFPDSMSASDIEGVLSRQFGLDQNAQAENEARSPQNITQFRPRKDIIRDLQIAQSSGDMSIILPLVDELSQVESVTGGSVEQVIEPLATIASSAFAEPVAGLAGIAQAVNPFADRGAGARAVETVREALTYQPATKTGKEGLQAVGEAFAPVGQALQSTEEFLGDTALDATGSPTIASAAATLPTALMSALPAAKIFKNSGKPTKSQSAIIESLQENPRNPNLAKFIPETGKKSKSLKQAVKQSGSPELVAVMKSSAQADKAAFRKMLDIVSKGKLDPVFADKVRVGDVVGKALESRLSDLKALNKRAGILIDDVARKQLKGKSVNIADAKSAFKQGLDNLRVSYNSKTGGVDFSGSALEGAGAGQARDLVKNIAQRLRRDVIGADDAHFMKRLIDQKVSFGKSDSGFSGQIDRNIKNLRKGINDALGDQFPEYRKANSKYSKTVNAINNFQDSSGAKVDLSSKEALGVSARRLTSNTQSRAKMLDSLDEIQDVLLENGIKYKDDVLTQVHVANAIDRRFKTQAATGFEKSVASGFADSAIKPTEVLTIDLLGKAVDKVSGVTDEKALSSLKKILE